MRAVVRDTYCTPDQLQLRELGRPVAGDDDVLVRVHAAGLDQGVWHLVTGVPYLMRAATGLRRPKVRVPGMDLAGRVEAVGANVTRFRPGDRVFGTTTTGSFAEYACVRADRLAAVPANLSFEQAAAVPVSGCAALQGLRDRGDLQAGQHVLITGAGGGVGSFAVQLAKAMGARVTAVTRTAKTDRVAGLGADDVVDYTREDPTTRTGRYDLILDTAGNRPTSRLRRALTPRGTLVIVGGPEGGGRWLAGAGRSVGAMVTSAFVRHSLRSLLSTESQEDLQILAGHLATGSITPLIDTTYPLHHVPAAIAHLKTGRPTGKIVIIP